MNGMLRRRNYCADFFSHITYKEEYEKHNKRRKNK